MEGELKNAARPVGSAEERYVSIKDACARLGISRSALFRLIRQQQMQRYRRARDPRTYLRLTDLEAARNRMPSQKRELIDGTYAVVDQSESRGGS
jgi:transposase-like protein